MAKNKFKIELGDPSDDGHGKYETVFIKTAGTEKAIEKAFAKLRTKGIDFDNICQDYEDCNIDRSDVEKMKKLGVEVTDLLEAMEEENEDFTYVDQDTYVGLLVDCLNAVDSKLDVEIVPEESVPSIGTFGYGLF
jgi:hypothetical protein